MEQSIREKRIRKITNLYYSKPDIQKAIFEFCKNRETIPRYFEGFGKRPDSFEYKGDSFELVKKGATSLHCSEEIWQDPMKIYTGMNEEQANELRIGWDLLIDIDCKWFDYSKLAAKAVIKTLKKHKIKKIGVKFSGGKGWHILIPWKTFPKEINGIKTSSMFPELPRKIISYIRYYSEKILQESLPKDFYSQFKNVKIKRGVKCKICNEVAREYEQVELYCSKCKRSEIRKFEKNEKKEESFCPECKGKISLKNQVEMMECINCNFNSIDKPSSFSKNIEVDLFELMGLDLVLVSPRHLFRTPYSLHEKTSLASVVIDPEKVSEFEMKDADPMKVKVKDFMPNVEEGEAKELITQALDWYKDNNPDQEEKKTGDFKQIKLSNLSEKNFPPCIKNILKGISDGRQRSIFVLISLFRSVGMDRDELEKRMYDWNEKNTPPLKQGIIKNQLKVAYKGKPLMAPNCKEYYQGIGVCEPDSFCKLIKNPVNYLVRKTFSSTKKEFKPKKNKK
ncbi:hypothetical protein KAI04_02640 [Candidatus Pacearchaeota archaeon]|nr:hypothetical protein [Candidatus Pacearchaeota archaeon]